MICVALGLSSLGLLLLGLSTLPFFSCGPGGECRWGRGVFLALLQSTALAGAGAFVVFLASDFVTAAAAAVGQSSLSSAPLSAFH